MLRTKVPRTLVASSICRRALISSPTYVTSISIRYNSSTSVESEKKQPTPQPARLEFLRSPGDDPDNYRSEVDGTFAGRVILPAHETSFPHVNVLELVERPDENIDLLPTLSKSELKSIPGLFSSPEFASAAEKVLDAVKELGALPSWPDIEKKYPELETQLSRIQDLKSGDKVVIVGGGISGLSLAWFLGISRPDLNISLFESKPRVGGWMNTKSVEFPESAKDPENHKQYDDYNEWGPRTLQAPHTGSALIRIMLNKIGVLEECMLGVPKSSPSNRKALLFKGKPTPLPASTGELWRFMAGPMSKGIKFAPFRDLIMRARNPEVRDESVESYISRRFGSSVATRFVSAIMRGIYAADISKLSARSVVKLGKTYGIEVDNPSMISSMMNGSGRGSDAYAAKSQVALLQAIADLPYEDSVAEMSKYTVTVLKDGISSLANIIAKDLEENFSNVKLIKNSVISEVSPFQNGESVLVKSKSETGTHEIQAQWVVSTVPGYSLAEMLKPAEPELSDQVENSLSYTTVGVVNVVTPHKFVGHNWFGYLVSKEEDANGYNPHGVLGVIFNTAVRNGARELNRIPVPHPYQTMKIHKEDSGGPKGESFLDNYDIKKFEDEHLRKTLLTDAPLIGKDEKPIVGDPPLPKHGNITLIFGGSSWADMTLEEMPTEQELIAATKDVFKTQLDTDLDAEKDVDIQVKMQYKCIPIYGVGHRERMQALKDQVSEKFNNRLTLTGMSFGRGAGIGDNVLDSFWLAVRHTPERQLLFPAFYLNQWLSLNYPSLMK